MQSYELAIWYSGIEDAARVEAERVAAERVALQERAGTVHGPVTDDSAVPAAPSDFLACVRARESGGNYTVHELSGASQAAGAYQFLPSTWNSTAAAAGRPDLVGVDPANASPADQDAMAQALYASQGAAPWGGYCG